ncbi:MAG: D-tyrosyl-tRNA(Tyr) deacylase [Gammaproteobacteria bacterium]|nr:D-tyrosyl-tRNA(Tyr) deacylase [Gammaproteobacteria bacterium]
MIGLLQRVTHACVTVDGQVIGRIDAGLMVLIGVERGDTRAQGKRLVQRLLGYRVFCDAQGKMNLSVRDTGGGLLLVPQFTLPADTRRGMRPSFTPAAAPEDGRRLFDYVVSCAKEQHAKVHTGAFGASMQVALINDGPVTFWLQVN